MLVEREHGSGYLLRSGDGEGGAEALLMRMVGGPS